MEGERQFGLILAYQSDDGQWEMIRHGTVLKITDIKLLADGRSYVNTVATKRFEVHETWVVDGYNMGRISFYYDAAKGIEQMESEEILFKEIVDRLKSMASKKYSSDGVGRFAEFLVRRLLDATSPILTVLTEG